MTPSGPICTKDADCLASVKTSSLCGLAGPLGLVRKIELKFASQPANASSAQTHKMKRDMESPNGAPP
jgi:hypothetical protein